MKTTIELAEKKLMELRMAYSDTLSENMTDEIDSKYKDEERWHRVNKLKHRIDRMKLFVNYLNRNV